MNVREQSSILANKRRPVCINIDISIAKGIRILLRTPDIKFILVGRICVFLIKSFFKVFYVDSSLDFLRGFLKRGNVRI